MIEHRHSKLKELQLSENKISEIVITNSLNSIKIMNLSSNEIQCFKGFQLLCDSVEVLNLSSNSIPSINIDRDGRNCLTSLRKLKILNLNYNDIG
jgi:hypothetical protein